MTKEEFLKRKEEFIKKWNNHLFQKNEFENDLNSIIEENNSLEPALLAAGKMRLAADLVISANTKNLSSRIETLENAMNIYNNEIIKLGCVKIFPKHE